MAKHEGRCALCGKHTELTFEHVPPKAAFNKDRVKSYSLLDSINDKDRLPWDVSGVPYTSLQKGSGFYSLCKECNNNTGALYGNAYRSMAYSIAHALSEYDETTHHAITLTKVPAHQFIKQILSMFCSLNGYDVVERFPHPNVLINPEKLSPIQKTIYESTAAIYHAAHSMDSIRNFVLNVKDQDKRYKEYRKSYSLTLEELAAIIGVNRKNIERLETPPSGAAGNIAHKVDPFYLEALSLIYYEDPYTLLGLEPALISPIRYERTTHADYIMNTLTTYPQDQMERALHIFGKIAMLTKSQFDVLCQIVAPLPVFKRLRDCPVDLRHVERFVQRPMPFEFPKSRQNSPAYKRSVLINSVS